MRQLAGRRNCALRLAIEDSSRAVSERTYPLSIGPLAVEASSWTWLHGRAILGSPMRALLAALLVASSVQAEDFVALPGGPPVDMDYLAYDPASGRLFIPAGNTGKVDVLDTRSGKLSAPIDGWPTARSTSLRRGRSGARCRAGTPSRS